MNMRVINIRDDLVKFIYDVCDIKCCLYKLENVFVLFGENFILFFVFKV